MSGARARQADAPVPVPLPTVEQQIAGAVLPLPKEMQPGATVMGYRDGATNSRSSALGKNGMICLAQFVVEKSYHVSCYQEGMEPFMARGRELRAQGVKDPKVDTRPLRRSRERKDQDAEDRCALSDFRQSRTARIRRRENSAMFRRCWWFTSRARRRRAPGFRRCRRRSGRGSCFRERRKRTS